MNTARFDHFYDRLKADPDFLTDALKSDLHDLILEISLGNLDAELTEETMQLFRSYPPAREIWEEYADGGLELPPLDPAPTFSASPSSPPPTNAPKFGRLLSFFKKSVPIRAAAQSDLEPSESMREHLEGNVKSLLWRQDEHLMLTLMAIEARFQNLLFQFRGDQPMAANLVSEYGRFYVEINLGAATQIRLHDDLKITLPS